MTDHQAGGAISNGVVQIPDDADWRYVLCPLNVVRKKYDEATDTYSPVRATCGEELQVEREGGEVLLAHGPTGDDDCGGPFWKVSCRAGHVLVVPDHEGDDRFDEIPFDWRIVRPILEAMGCDFRAV